MVAWVTWGEHGGCWFMVHRFFEVRIDRVRAVIKNGDGKKGERKL
jgi:hypothetical protein